MSIPHDPNAWEPGPAYKEDGTIDYGHPQTKALISRLNVQSEGREARSVIEERERLKRDTATRSDEEPS